MTTVADTFRGVLAEAEFAPMRIPVLSNVTAQPHEDHAIAEAYGVWKEKSMYGRTYMGIERTTFLIGADGKIEKIFPKVKPEGHAAQVLEAIAS